MNIVLFHDFLVRMGGAEHVLHTMSTLFPESPIYTFFYDEKKVEAAYPGLSKRIIPHPMGQKLYTLIKHVPILQKISTKLFLRLFPSFIEDIDLSKYDLIVASSTAWAHGLVPGSKTTFVCYLHSPMRFAWDWYNEYKYELGVKKTHSLFNIFLTWSLSKVRMWDQITFKKDSLLLCNSKTVQKRVLKYYKRRDTEVLYPPVAIEQIPAPTSDTPAHLDHFLIISTLTKYKRIEVAIELFNKLGKKLIIIGDGPYGATLKHRAASNITFTGYISNEEKFEYLQNARALILVTEEDFGIVPIEAMAAGKPVLALAKGGAREYIVPGVTGEFFQEQTIESMEKGLAELLQNEDEYNPLTIRKHAERYSTGQFIKNFKRILKEKKGIELPS